MKPPVWICGGGQIYRKLLPACRELYLSVISKEYGGDAMFPDFEDLFVKDKVVMSTSEFEVLHFFNKNAIKVAYANNEEN